MLSSSLYLIQRGYKLRMQMSGGRNIMWKTLKQASFFFQLWTLFWVKVIVFDKEKQALKVKQRSGSFLYMKSLTLNESLL